MPKYHHRRLEELALQLGQAATNQRLAQLDHAESLIREIDPDRTYSYFEVVEAITGYRPRGPEGRGIPARALRADLVTLVEHVSGTMRISVDSVAEQVLTTEQLTERFGVSQKTISRWRRLGLSARRYVRDGRLIVCFRESSAAWFESAFADTINRARRFTHMSAGERGAILDLARAAREVNPTQTVTDLASTIAAKCGRSVESIRTTLRDNGIGRASCDEATVARQAMSRRALRAWRAGDDLVALATTLGLEPGELDGMIRAERLSVLKARDLTAIASEEFHKRAVVRQIRLQKLPLQRVDQVLTADEERQAFRHYNYRKLRLAQMVGRVEPAAVTHTVLDALEREFAEVIAIRNWLVHCNIRLVVRIARQHAGASAGFADAVSEGNLALMRAVDGFDYARGFKFSTYAGWAIKRALASAVPAEAEHRRRFAPVDADILSANADLRMLRPDEAADRAGLCLAVRDLLRHLSDRERAVIIENFGLDDAPERTLEDIGRRHGVSKERVRQIKVEALSKLRELMPADV